MSFPLPAELVLYVFSLLAFSEWNAGTVRYGYVYKEKASTAARRMWPHAVIGVLRGVCKDWRDIAEEQLLWGPIFRNIVTHDIRVHMAQVTDSPTNILCVQYLRYGLYTKPVDLKCTVCNKTLFRTCPDCDETSYAKGSLHRCPPSYYPRTGHAHCRQKEEDITRKEIERSRQRRLPEILREENAFLLEVYNRELARYSTTPRVVRKVLHKPSRRRRRPPVFTSSGSGSDSE